MIAISIVQITVSIIQSEILKKTHKTQIRLLSHAILVFIDDTFQFIDELN